MRRTLPSCVDLVRNSHDSALHYSPVDFGQGSFTDSHVGRAIMSYPIDGGKLLNIAAMDMEHPTWEHEKWIVPTQWDTVAQRFEGWGKRAQDIVEVRSSLPM